MRHISKIDLSNNHLTGAIPSGPLPLDIGSPYFDVLIVASNYITGQIPQSICKAHYMGALDLSNNIMEGTFTQCLQMGSLLDWKLGLFGISTDESQLVLWAYSSQHHKSQIPSVFKFSKQQYIRRYSTVPIKFSSYDRKIPKVTSWLPRTSYEADVFQGNFPVAMKREELNYGARIDEGFGINLSLNRLTGTIPDEITCLTRLLTSNLLWNQFSGNIIVNLGEKKPLESLDLSWNNLSGEIPPSLADLTYLSYLDLSQSYRNNSTWTLTWHSTRSVLKKNMKTNMKSVISVRIQSDYTPTLYTGNPSMYDGNFGLCGPPLDRNCSGSKLPESGLMAGLWVVFCALLFKKTWRRIAYFRLFDEIYDKVYVFASVTWGRLATNADTGEDKRIKFLKMRSMIFLLIHNSFYGLLPSSLCSSILVYMDLSWNKFPRCIGNMIYLCFLHLSHNMFDRHIPVNITNLRYLRYLNLAGNNISGAIPRSYTAPETDIFGGTFPFLMKRQEHNYGATIDEVVGTDLSLNQLIGTIPDEITSLTRMLNLSLSWNQFSRNIIKNLGKITSLESLDLSWNNLLGEIPPSLADLTYLRYLDLLYNNLTGTIPHGCQLDTLYTENPSMYDGNFCLCGPPPDRNCSGSKLPESGNCHRKNEKVSELTFLYLGIGSGSGLRAHGWLVGCVLE
ncbi:LOW QUALITY PROTEIN: hypothetical protein U9M48_002291 [Paspalum notatum var. saurae]|uniref:Uncharacterized protein n=1 Tax=Paspalum notatum var. saurae TaxID=547442 RepID=A0AAQ3PKQ9_PASNO